MNPPKKNRTNAQSLRTRRQSVSTRQSLAIRRELARNSEFEWPIPPSLSYPTLLVWNPDPNTVTTTSLGLVKSPSVLPTRVAACQKPSGRESILASKSRDSHNLSGADNLRGRSGDFCPFQFVGGQHVLSSKYALSLEIRIGLETAPFRDNLFVLSMEAPRAIV